MDEIRKALIYADASMRQAFLLNDWSIIVDATKKVDEALSLPQPEGETRANLISNRKLGQLLELIDKLCRLGNGEHDGNSIGNKIAQEARTILLSAEPSPSSEKALLALAADKADAWLDAQTKSSGIEDNPAFERLRQRQHASLRDAIESALASSSAPEAPK